MSEETLHLLMIRFTDAVQELEEGQNQFPLSNLFEYLGKILKEINVSDATIRLFLVSNLYKLLDILPECQTFYKRRKKHAIPAAREWFFLRTIKLRLSKIILKFEPVLKEWESRRTVGITPTVPGSFGGLSENHQTHDCSNPYGLDVQREVIVSLLQKESENVISPIGIVGIAGSGKTSLARLVYNDDRVKKEFVPRIWVSLSRKADSKTDFTANIVHYLLKQLSEVDEVTCNTSLDDQLATLYKHLSGKKYLIVFDDVWHIKSWYKMLVNSEMLNDMFCGLSKEPGGRIIITSRLHAETKEMIGAANVYELAPLDRDSCWSIFTDAANGYEIISSIESYLTKMKAEILDNCNGHPLAARILADAFCQRLS
ncbi:hypothetical protein ACHQM5_025634 [Ranunculus cassubicifolius]